MKPCGFSSQTRTHLVDLVEYVILYTTSFFSPSIFRSAPQIRPEHSNRICLSAFCKNAYTHIRSIVKWGGRGQVVLQNVKSLGEVNRNVYYTILGAPVLCCIHDPLKGCQKGMGEKESMLVESNLGLVPPLLFHQCAEQGKLNPTSTKPTRLDQMVLWISIFAAVVHIFQSLSLWGRNCLSQFAE